MSNTRQPKKYRLQHKRQAVRKEDAVEAIFDEVVIWDEQKPKQRCTKTS